MTVSLPLRGEATQRKGLGGGVHSEMAQWVEMPAAKPGKLSSTHRTHMLEGESMAVSCPLPLYWYPSHLACIQSKKMNVILKRKKEKAEDVDPMVEPFPDWHSALS